MKKLFVSLLAIVSLTLVLSSCNYSAKYQAAMNQALVKAYTGTANESLPLTFGGTGTVKTITFENGTVTISFEVNEEYADPSLMSGSKEDLLGIMSYNKEIQSLLDSLPGMGTALAIEYRGNKSGKSGSVNLTADEVANLACLNVSREKAANMIIESAVKMESKNMPKEIEPQINLTQVLWEGNTLVFIVTLDSKVFTMEGLQAANISGLENVTQNIIARGDLCSLPFIEAMNAQKKSIVYRFKLDNNDFTRDIVLDSKFDLKTIVSKSKFK